MNEKSFVRQHSYMTNIATTTTLNEQKIICTTEVFVTLLKITFHQQGHPFNIANLTFFKKLVLNILNTILYAIMDNEIGKAIYDVEKCDTH